MSEAKPEPLPVEVDASEESAPDTTGEPAQAAPSYLSLTGGCRQIGSRRLSKDQSGTLLYTPSRSSSPLRSRGGGSIGILARPARNLRLAVLSQQLYQNRPNRRTNDRNVNVFKKGRAQTGRGRLLRHVDLR